MPAGAARGFRDRHRPLQRASLHRAHGAAAGLGPDAMGRRRLAEVGRRGDTGEVVRIDPRYFRPAEVETCWVTRASKKCWAGPRRCLEELVAEMVSLTLRKPRKRHQAQGLAVVGARE